MAMRTISIANDFSRFPAGRFRADGPASGERFRDDILVPALRQGEVELVLDGVAGLPSSFLEEVIGGLIREAGFTPEEVEQRLKFVANTARMSGYPAQARNYLAHAKAAPAPPT